MHKYFNLLNQSLPVEISPIKLDNKIIDKLSVDNAWYIAFKLLKQDQRINWQAYTDTYDDVKQAGIDPCLHYVKYGIYEGRVIHSVHPLSSHTIGERPLISILISNFNNGIYLEKCIRSAIGQTLENIEIIIVDDASLDNSRCIINRFAQEDKRIKVVLNSVNKGTFITRKQSVNASKGRYIMFLDSDDYLNHKACEVAYLYISKGYDIVKFGANIFNAESHDKNRIKKFNDYINKQTPSQIYYNDEIINAIFLNNEISWNLWDKIYLRDICVQAYNDVPEGFYLRSEDRLGTIAIIRLARTLFVIKNKLYNHNFGVGGSSTLNKSTNLKNLLNFCDTAKATISYINKHGMHAKFKQVSISTLHYVLQLWSNIVPNSDVKYYLDEIINRLGFSDVLRAFIDIINKHQVSILNKLKSINKSVFKYPKKIVLIYYKLDQYDFNYFILPMYKYLKIQHIDLIILTENYPEYDITVPKDMNIIFIPPALDTKDSIYNHCILLKNTLVELNPDLLIYKYYTTSPIIFDIFIFKHLGLPIILNYNNGFPYLLKNINLNTKSQLVLFSCFSGVICLDKFTGILFNNYNINTYRIYPDISQSNLPLHSSIPFAISIIIDKHDTLNNIRQYILIINEIVKKNHGIDIYFIGDFIDPSLRRKFFALIREYHLSEHIIFIGETSTPEIFLTKTAFLLSTECDVSFSYKIAIAQSCALPCIAYDIPSDQLSNNHSILKIAQNHVEDAATAAKHLLSNTYIHSLLSSTSLYKSLRYSYPQFCTACKDMLDNITHKTVETTYSNNDYQEYFRYSNLYASM